MARSSKHARQERQARERQEKRTAARDELIRGALTTLSDLGYAQTSLRDIAEQTGRSVGLVYYYFDDKAADHRLRPPVQDRVRRVHARVGHPDRKSTR